MVPEPLLLLVPYRTASTREPPPPANQLAGALTHAVSADRDPQWQKTIDARTHSPRSEPWNRYEYQSIAEPMTIKPLIPSVVHKSHVSFVQKYLSCIPGTAVQLYRYVPGSQ